MLSDTFASMGKQPPSPAPLQPGHTGRAKDPLHQFPGQKNGGGKLKEHAGNRQAPGA